MHGVDGGHWIADVYHEIRELLVEWQQSVNPLVRMGGLGLAVVFDPGTVVKPRKIGGQVAGSRRKVCVPMCSGLRNLTSRPEHCASKVFARVFKVFLLISKLVPTS